MEDDGHSGDTAATALDVLSSPYLLSSLKARVFCVISSFCVRSLKVFAVSPTSQHKDTSRIQARVAENGLGFALLFGRMYLLDKRSPQTESLSVQTRL
jgi:hypothetical protein